MMQKKNQFSCISYLNNYASSTTAWANGINARYHVQKAEHNTSIQGPTKFMATHILTWFSNKNEEIENLLQQLIAK